jgi:hypothetical protein
MNCRKCRYYLCIDRPYCGESVYPPCSPLAVEEIQIGLAGDCDKGEPVKSD